MKRKVISKAKRNELLDKWEHRCVYCGQNIDYHSMQVDHGVPLILQGSVSLLGKYTQLPTNNLEDSWNLFPACRDCNNWKGGMTIKQFRIELCKQVDRCYQYSRNYRMALRFAMIDVISKQANFIMDSKVPMCITEFDVSEATKRHLAEN